MSSKIPDGWSYNNLSELAFIDNDSLKGSTDPDYKFKYVDIAAVSTGSIKLPTKYIRFKDAPSRARKRVKQGDVLMSTVRPNLQSFAYFDANTDDYIASTGFAVIRAKDGNDGKFLFNTILADDVTGQIDTLIVGSNYPAINSSDVKILEVLTPTKPEQQKIAQILTSVDEVIEKTQAQIDKLKDLKTAMMQELLTQGVCDENGKRHVEFKDSPVGRIPVGWEVKTIEGLNISVLDGDRGKEYPKDKDFFQHEHCLFLSAKNVTKKGFRFDVSMFITEKKDNAMRKGKLKRGDIVITTRGTLGNIAYFNAEIPFENVRINSGMAIIRNDKTAVSTEFLNILLHSPLVNEQTELLAFGSAIPQLTIGLLKNLNIPVPSIEEQDKISAMINLVSHKIILIESKLTSLKNTKKALMQDLLTGKVRVNLDTHLNDQNVSASRTSTHAALAVS
jgi:type I restriction enzyme S subunit